jgi:catechol 2,3-dioxygenase-like lactoylglutathione lyase family enzyme
MIQRMTHVTIYVNNQQEALEFYRDKLGFEVRTANQMRALVEKGVLGAGVFETANCQATYEELQKKGVEFVAPPEDKFYGVEAIFKDNSGNWFSLSQHKPH